VLHFPSRLPIALIGVASYLVSVQVLAATRSPTEIAQVAKSTTISITSDEGIGSGVLIRQQGKRYLVATAAHVVKNPNSDYVLTAGDGGQYPLNAKLFDI
jgi:serine protease Do